MIGVKIANVKLYGQWEETYSNHSKYITGVREMPKNMIFLSSDKGTEYNLTQ